MDMVRLGKADWNYFSNYMYGVPEEQIQPHNAIPDTVRSEQASVKIGSKTWDVLSLNGMDMVSAYAPGGAGLTYKNSPAFTPMWRTTFGGPVGKVDNYVPFAGTVMDSQMYMSFRVEGGRYKTVVFGGTARELHGGPAFLAAQMDACRTVILTYYPSLGF
jgi:hypothetical protein